MARPNSMVRIGSVVDPFKGLQGALSQYSDKLSRELQAEKEQNRWDIANARAEEKMQQQRGLLAKEKDKEHFLKEYDPRVGELGGRGVNKNTLKGYSTLAGKDVNTVLGRYGVSKDKSIGELSKDEQGRLGAELSGLASKMQPELRSLGTKEEVESLVFDETLQNTGDPELARNLAKVRSEGLLGRKELREAEEKATEEANKTRKEFSDLAKYMARSRGKSTKGSSSSNGIKAHYIDKDTRDTEIKELGLDMVFSGDTDTAIEYVDDAIKEGVSPSIAMLALKDSLKRGGFTDDKVSKSKADFLKHADKLQNMVKQSSNKTGAIEHTPEELAFILAQPQQSRSYEAIQRDRGISAYGDLLNRPTSTATPTASSPAVPRDSTYASTPTPKVGEDEVVSPAEEAAMPTKKEVATVVEDTVPKSFLDNVKGMDRGTLLKEISEMETLTGIPFTAGMLKGATDNELKDILVKNKIDDLTVDTALGTVGKYVNKGANWLESTFTTTGYFSDATEADSIEADRKALMDRQSIDSNFLDSALKENKQEIGRLMDFVTRNTGNTNEVPKESLYETGSARRASMSPEERAQFASGSVGAVAPELMLIGGGVVPKLGSSASGLAALGKRAYNAGKGLLSSAPAKRTLVTPSSVTSPRISNEALRLGSKNVVEREAAVANRLNQLTGKRAFAQPTPNIGTSPILSKERIRALKEFQEKNSL